MVFSVPRKQNLFYTESMSATCGFITTKIFASMQETDVPFCIYLYMIFKPGLIRIKRGDNPGHVELYVIRVPCSPT